MSMPSVGQMIATAVLVGLVLWGKSSWDTYQAMKMATLRTELEKKVREELEAEAAAAMESEKKVREKLKAEAGAEISALERQKLFESGMAYTTRGIYEKGMAEGENKAQGLVLAAEIWALGTVHGERSRQVENAGPQYMNNPGLERGQNVGLRRGPGFRRTNGAQQAPPAESSYDGEEEYHGSHR